ncbi:MAG TPA: hypothetical protein VFR85_14150 [Anaeromyxobacteraceae bacterium]|nr:hypothetical protein [Anaeromyxobacteraceae bacterium]
MRARLALLTLLAAAAGPGQCGGSSYDPCDGKACGDACRVCPPDDARCAETAVVKACDPVGRCVAWVADLCPIEPPDPCAGKVCGQTCVWDPPCRQATPPCMAPSALGRCDAAGQCIPGGAVTCQPVADCAGQPCGVTCDLCGGMCMHPYATACDGSGQCVPWSFDLCPP